MTRVSWYQQGRRHCQDFESRDKAEDAAVILIAQMGRSCANITVRDLEENESAILGRSRPIDDNSK